MGRNSRIRSSGGRPARASAGRSTALSPVDGGDGTSPMIMRAIAREKATATSTPKSPRSRRPVCHRCRRVSAWRPLPPSPGDAPGPPDVASSVFSQIVFGTFRPSIRKTLSARWKAAARWCTMCTDNRCKFMVARLCPITGGDMLEALFRRVDDKRDELVRLTQDLIRIPTVNPPGEAYTPCAEFIGTRLTRRGFQVTYMRGEDTPGDSDRYPRTNVIARREGRGPALAFISIRHIDVVEAGHGWTSTLLAGVVRDGRVYGRGACDMKGGLAAAIIAIEALLEGAARSFPAPSRSPARSMRNPAASAAWPIWPNARDWFSQTARRARHHPRAAQQGPRLPRPSRRLVGGDRDAGPHRPRLDAVPRRLRRAPHGSRARALRTDLYPKRLDRKQTAMPVVPRRRQPLDAQHQRAPWHGGQDRTAIAACPRPTCRTAAGW
jgi:hypothetical protein